MLTGSAVFERIGSVAANSLLRCGVGSEASGGAMLFSLDYPTAIALTDRSFGGNGKVAGDKPEALPRSAALLVEQFSRILAIAIAQTSSASDAAGDAASAAAQGEVIMRSESAARLKPFEPEVQCCAFILTVTSEDGAQWTSLFAFPESELNGLLPGLLRASNAPLRKAEPSDGTKGATSSIPLPIEAVLAEFELPLRKLDRLAPGDELPLSLAREVPVRIGALTFAHGSLGTLEDRIALRLTKIDAQGAPS